MTRNSSESCWSSDDSSFGWVEMEGSKHAEAKKANAVQETSDSEEDSSDDSTDFVSEYKNRQVLNSEREKNENLKINGPVSTKTSRGQVKNFASEDSDSTQFDGESDRRPVQEDAVRSTGTLDIKGDQLKFTGAINTGRRETPENNASSESESESSDDSGKKDLKPFTKKISVKKERPSLSLSEESDIDSPPLRSRLRIKSESSSPQKRTKEDNNTPLIEGVLLDTAQPLPFNINADDDVWVVQCPYEMSESTLKGKSLNFNGISCAEQFEGSVLLTANPKPVNLLLPKSPLKLTSLTPTGHIIFREKEIAAHILPPLCNEDFLTSLPTVLKERHPLFGADLSLVQRLCSQQQKRKKKKKKKRDVSDVGTTSYEDENEILEAENSAKFSNKLDASPLHNKRKKKKSMHLDEQMVAFSHDSDIKNHSLQWSSFQSGSSPKMPSEKNKNTFVDNDCIQSELQQKKSKKVKHEQGEAVSLEFSNAHQELTYVTPAKKRKHRHLEHSFESDRQVVGGISDEAENMSSQKRKKRKYEDESNTSYDLNSTSEKIFGPNESVAESLNTISPKKKKRHKYEGDFQSENIVSANSKAHEFGMYTDVATLDPVHTVKKKKKKKIKEDDTEFMDTSNMETYADINYLSTKKKKKMKVENSDEHLVQFKIDARDTKNNVCDVSGANLDYFDVDRKKFPKEERRKFENTGHSTEFSEENSASNKFLKHTIKEELAYLHHSPVTDVHKKKKMKRKSE